ncbi:hypothetical protein B0H19DRAFT_1243188 [Mycena capillaripes]|nr:hypothetical protein B0H19DRAFT_1243188 [Mycena capillaripes]
MLARQFVSVLRTHLRNPDTTARAPPHIEPGAHYHLAYATAYEYLASSTQHPALVELPGLLGWRSMTVQCRRIGCSKGQAKAVHGDAQQVQHRVDETQIFYGSQLFNFIQRKADWEGSCRSVCNSEPELVNKEVPGNKREQSLDSPFIAVDVEESTYDLRRASGVDPLDIDRPE